MSPCFVIAHGVPVPNSLPHALQLVEQVLRSDKFLKQFLILVPDATKDSVLRCLNDGGFIIDTIRSWTELKAYASTYREINPRLIALNPILLCEMMKRESESVAEVEDGQPHKKQKMDNAYVDVDSTHTYFLMVKIVHEMSYLLHWLCSEMLRSTSTRTKLGKIKKVARTPPKHINGNRFDDLGNMIEYLVFGGITEHSEHVHHQPFGLDELLLLPFAGDPNPKVVYRVDSATMVGHALDIKTTLLPQKIEQVAFCGDRGKTFPVSSAVSNRAGVQAAYGGFSSPVVAPDLQATELDSENEAVTAPQEADEEYGEDEEDEEDEEEKHSNCMSKYAIV